MPPKTKPSSADWEKQKEPIRRLYLDKNLTLHAVRRHLEDDGFTATKAQYEAKFKEWGFSKNVPVNIWKHVGFKIGKRKREGKDSTVSINGIEIPIKRVKKEISRHYYSAIERAEFGKPDGAGGQTLTDRGLTEKINAPSPPGSLAVISTPPSQQEVLIVERWPSNLPWFSFIRFLNARPEGQPRMQLNPQTFQGGLAFTQKKSQANNILVEQPRTKISIGRQLIFDTIKEFASSDLNHAVLPFSSDIKWPAEIDPSTSLKSTSSTHWGLKVVIYLVSNKLLETYELDRIWQMIKETGIKQLANFSSGSYTTDTSLAAAMESLFAAGIQHGHTNLVSWLLETGLDPNQKVKEGVRDVHLSLIASMPVLNDYDRVKMVRLLLSKGASPVLSCCEEHGTPIQFLFWKYSSSLELTYLDAYSEMLDAFLEAAKTLQHRPISQSVPHFERSKDADPLLYHEPREEVAQKLDRLINLNEDFAARTLQPYLSLFSPTSLIRAVEGGQHGLIRVLRQHGLPMDCCDADGRFPLQVAIERSRDKHDRLRLSTVSLLLELGASPNYIPGSEFSSSCSLALEAAVNAPCDNHNFNIYTVTLLIEGGANAQGRPTCGESGHSTLVDCALSRDDWLPGDLTTVLIALHHAGLPLSKWSLIHVLTLAWKQTKRWKPYSLDHDYKRLLEVVSGNAFDLSLRSRSGWTALDYAVLLQQDRLVSLLVKLGAEHTRIFAYGYCLSRRSSVGGVEEVMSRVPSPRNIKQSRDLLYHHLIGSLRATDLVDPTPERTLEMLRAYCTLPRSMKHDGHIIYAACRKEKADIMATILQSLPSAYSPLALGTLVTSHESRDWSRQAYIDELLRRRTDTPMDWAKETRMFAQVVNRALEGERDARTLKWFRKHDRNAIEYANTEPSTFAIRVFSLGQSWQTWRNPDVSQWLKCGLKPSSYLGLLVVHSGNVEKMKSLFRRGFQPNRRIDWSLTALQLAVARADMPMTLQLLKAGCDVNARPPWRDIPESIWPHIPRGIQDVLTSYERKTHRRTALQLAVEIGDPSMTRLLLDHGADVNRPAARVQGATALQIACIKGYIEVVRLLISRGADVNAPGAEYFGRTALEGAAEHGRLDVACFLLEHDCRVDGPFKRQYIRSVGLARAQAHHILSKELEYFGKWKKEDEDLLKQTHLRDKKPRSHNLGQDLYENEDVSDVDTDEFEYDSDVSMWDPEGYDSTSEERDAASSASHGRKTTDEVDGPDRSIRPSTSLSLDWDDFVQYDGDDEGENSDVGLNGSFDHMYSLYFPEARSD